MTDRRPEYDDSWNLLRQAAERARALAGRVDATRSAKRRARRRPCRARNPRSAHACERPRGHDRWHMSIDLVWDAESSWWRARIVRRITGASLRWFGGPGG